MLKIGIVGFTGRVNQALLEEIAKRNDCAVSGILVKADRLEQDYHLPLLNNISELAKLSDAIIDFSNPENSLKIDTSLQRTPTLLVSGTTGFTEEQFNQFQECSTQLPIIWSANMSLGINLLHQLLQIATPILSKEFDTAIIDIHHQHKKDSPSGTALALANTIKSKATDNKIQISSLRIGEEFGSHQIIFSGPDESITFHHKSLGRKGYAKGAIDACFWGQNKKSGFYTMQDVYFSL